ncbi:MAG: glycoside hydrolase family protein [Methylobacter sp.]
MPNPNADSALVNQLKRHEGFRPHVYRCTAGKQTVGYGRNLDDTGISEREATVLLTHDISRAAEDLIDQVPVFPNLSLNRQNVLVNMAVNMGIPRLLGFKKMLAALRANDFDLAADEMLDSQWAKQVGNRATELAQQMRTNVLQGG